MPGPAPSNKRNHPPVYDDFAATVKHLDKVEALGAFDDGIWRKPNASETHDCMQQDVAPSKSALPVPAKPGLSPCLYDLRAGE